MRIERVSVRCGSLVGCFIGFCGLDWISRLVGGGAGSVAGQLASVYREVDVFEFIFRFYRLTPFPRFL